MPPFDMSSRAFGVTNADAPTLPESKEALESSGRAKVERGFLQKDPALPEIVLRVIPASEPQGLDDLPRAISAAPARIQSAEIGAVEKTRTSTGVTPQRPQRCASTNSATTARIGLELSPLSERLRTCEEANGQKRPTAKCSANQVGQSLQRSPTPSFLPCAPGTWRWH